VGRGRAAAAARRGGREDGLSVIEVVIAGLILTIGSLGVLGMVDASSRNTFRVEQRQVVSNVLQREMEQVKELAYEEIALTEAPAAESGENNPNSRVEGTAFHTNRNGTGLKPLVYNGGTANGETISGGTVDPGPTPFAVEDVRGTVYRYVVWDNCPDSLCTDEELLKRVVVAVKLDSTASGGADRRYQEIQGQVVDPEAEPSENPGPAPGGGSVTPWILWLTDATCDRTEPKTPAERAEEGNHLAHNTRRVCATGPKTGNAPGAPDLLWPAAPSLSDETPVYDYATDVEPEASPDTDKGLQLLVGDECAAMPATTIATSPDSDPTMFQQLHKWVTPPIPEASTDLTLTGEATFSLWTQSIEGGVYQAAICIWLFVREAGVDTAVVRPLESLTYFTYSESSWPSSGWTEVTVPMSFKDGETEGEVALPPGSRLGLALSVDDGSASGIQTLYDEPSFDSRIQLDVTGTLPSWP
jgi:hypothetical protein